MHFGENQLSRSLIAFHPYPQSSLGFQPKWVRASTTSYRRFTWPWIDHSASGLEHATKAPIRTRFRYASPHGLTSPHTTNSQAHSSKGTPSPLRLRRIVCDRFQVLFHSPPGVLFTSLTVLVRYRSPRSFRLSGWSRQIHAEFTGSA